MNNTGVIDRFLEVFSRYIDSGFGLLSGEVAFLATTLIVIDVTLAALFWAWAENDDVIARLVKKTLFVGVFAYIIGNWNMLANVILQSFAGLGLQASGGTLTAADLLRPGRIAEVGLDAGRPLLDAIGELVGFVSFFDNFLQIAILLLAWLLVLLSFFILAIQLFVTIIEFKLTTLAGFVLIPFGLFGKTAFLAERVLGNVVSSGIKVLVLAVIVGIGSTLFAEFTAGFADAPPTLEDAAAIMLGALSMLGLGIFGPGIANGIVSGGPQLGAGAAVGTGLAAGGVVAAGVGAARMTAGAASDLTKGALAGATQLPASRAGDASKGALGPASSGPGGAAGGGASSPPTPPPAPSSPTNGGSAGLPSKDGAVAQGADSTGAPAEAGGEITAATASESPVAEPDGADVEPGETGSAANAKPGSEAQTGADTPITEADEPISPTKADAKPTAGAESTSDASTVTGGAAALEPEANSPSGDTPAAASDGSANSATDPAPTGSEPSSDAAEAPAAVERLLAGSAAATEFAATQSEPTDTPEPAWAKSMRNRAAISRGVSAATHTLRSGDSRGSGASIDLNE